MLQRLLASIGRQTCRSQMELTSGCLRSRELAELTSERGGKGVQGERWGREVKSKRSGEERDEREPGGVPPVVRSRQNLVEVHQSRPLEVVFRWQPKLVVFHRDVVLRVRQLLYKNRLHRFPSPISGDGSAVTCLPLAGDEVHGSNPPCSFEAFIHFSLPGHF